MPSACHSVRPGRIASSSLAWALGLLLPLALAGCGNSSFTTFPPACPHTGILADAADLTRYRPGTPGHDLTDMVLDGRITGVSGNCSRAGSRQIEVNVSTSMTLVRGPAARGPVGDFQLFLAVSRDGQLLDKQVYQMVPSFGANSDTARLTSDPVKITLPVGPDNPGSAYDIVVGFQLTPDELAFNRRRGPR